MQRVHQLFNHDWLFIHDDKPSFSLPETDDSGWRKLNLPHDWSNEFELSENSPTGFAGGFVVAGTGWYRKHFSYDPAFATGITALRFDGVYMDSTVYLNGVKVGGKVYGYSEFSVDLTENLKEGDNVIAVRVDNSVQPNSRFYTGSGIYRNVWFERYDKVHIGEWGVYFYTKSLEEDSASLSITTTVDNDSDEDAALTVTERLYDKEGNLVLTDSADLTVAAGEKGTAELTPVLSNPHLWSNTDPYLYTLKTTVEAGGSVIDESCTRVGVRTATFDADQGFLLNGERVKIKGMCVHADCGLSGAVGYTNTWIRRLKLLKDMGCNGIRTAHNPPSNEMLSLCDEFGFLVMDEDIDEWYTVKAKGDIEVEFGAHGCAEYFESEGEDILRNMLRRDRNHPSVIIWCIGNEILDQVTEKGAEAARWMVDICHTEDPSRMVTSACDDIAATTGKTVSGFTEALDVVGYNYSDRWKERAETLYDEDRHKYPTRRFIGTENLAVGGDRGDYLVKDSSRPTRFDYRLWSLKTEWQWRYTASRDFLAGDYLWTGIDYLGETKWPRRGAACGPIDTAGFKKDPYYLFRSIWNEEDLTLHILPHWNWSGDEGQYKQVLVYSNCDKVELYINDKLVGTKGCKVPYYGSDDYWYEWMTPGKVQPTTHDLHLTFDVAYEPSVLSATRGNPPSSRRLSKPPALL